MDEKQHRHVIKAALIGAVAAIVAGVLAAAAGILGPVLAAYISRPEPQPASSSTLPSSREKTTPAPAAASSAPAESPPAGGPETGPQGLPYQRLDVAPPGDPDGASVYMTPPSGPMSNVIKVGGQGFPGNSQLRYEERTFFKGFDRVLPDGSFIALFVTPGDCDDYVISIFAENGKHLADLRYDTQC